MVQNYFFKNLNYQDFTPNYNHISFFASAREKKCKNYSFSLLLLLVFTFLFGNSTIAQTTIISPTGDGGFETGTSFTANGWSATTGTATENQWVCSTGATTGFSGTNVAYVTNNTAGTPPPHTYTVNPTQRVSHIYKNITVPSGEAIINLDFKYICNGESGYDYMRVWLVPTSYTPAYGTQITSTGSAPTGRVQVGLSEYNVQTIWTSATTISIPSSYAGTTFRLVFEWRNDTNAGTNLPAGVDDIALISTANPNDNCTTAIPLTVGTSCSYTSGTNVGATATTAPSTPPAPSCSSYSGGDVWYSVVVPASGQITINTQAGGITDSGIALYSGTCGALTQIACDDDSGTGNMSQLTSTGLTVGSTVYIRLWEYGNDTFGTFGICVTTPFTPCTSITNIASCGSNITATIAAGSDGIVGTTCYTTPGRETIYTFTPSTTGVYAIQQISGYNYIDYSYKLASGGCSATGWTCIDDLTGASTSNGTNPTLTAGTQYYIMLDPESTAGGTVVFNIVCPPTPPTNDNCANATSLPCSTTNLAGTTVNSVSETAIGTCSSNYGVWYTFPGDGYSTTISSTGAFDHAMVITSGNCGSVAVISCQDSSFTTETYTFTSTIGTTYRIYIANISGTTTGTFTISRTCVIPPSNDNCSGATSLTVNPTTTCTTSTSGTTVNATQSIAAITCNGFTGTADDDVWYSFTATSTSHIVTATAGTIGDFVIELRSGACNGTNINCSDSGNPEVITATGLTVGATYYVRLYSYSNGSNQGTFTICVTTPYNPCDSITNIASCGTTVNTTFTSGSGAYNLTSCYAGGTPGNEIIYTFTPSVTGNYSINQTSSFNYIDYFYKTVGTCSNTGWTCIQALNGAQTSGNITLTAGTQYYIMLDPENTTGGSVAFNITCVTYCTPTVTTGALTSTNYIDTVNFIGNITNSNNSSTYNNAVPYGYQDFTGLGSRASQAQSEGINVYMNTQGGANYMKAWVDWNNDKTFDTTTEVVYQCTNAFINTTFGFQVPAATVPGNYRIRLRINEASLLANNNFGPCDILATNGETEDYLFTVVANCDAKITTITDGSRCGTGSATLGAIGTAGTTEYRWYDAQTGGSQVGTTASTTWSTPSISATTTFYVTAYNGSCESLFRSGVTATVKPVATLTGASLNPEVCGENSIFDVSALGTNEQIYLIDEDFETGTLGVFSEAHYGTNGSDALTNWSAKTSTYVPAYPTYPVWYPAVSSGFGTNKFALTTSDITTGGNTFGKIDNALELTTAVNTTDFANLTLSFKMYFSSYYDSNSATTEYVIVEYKNGAGAWTAVPGEQYLSDIGIGTQFVTKSITMNAYINIAALKVRIRYKAGWCDGVAVDDIKLYGDKPLIPSFTFTGAPAGSIYTDAAATTTYTPGTPASTVYIKPSLVQLEAANFSITATATLTNGCTANTIINVTNNTKIWKGTTSNDWNVASNWLPAVVPDATSCVVIPDGSNDSKILNTPDALAKNLTIKSDGILDMEPSMNLTVTDWVKIEAGGIFNMKNNASLVQTNNTNSNSISGTFNMERITQPMYLLDYTYWGSPVSGFTLDSLSANSSLRYTWIPTVAANPNQSGIWNFEAAGTAMTPGKGYIVRAPDTYSNDSGTKIPYTANFIGAPNNGTITVPMASGSNTIAGPNVFDDNWNFLSNPYPCALNATTFLGHPSNAAEMGGTIYMWTHNSAPSGAYPDAFYPDTNAIEYTPNDYASWNLTGGVGTSASTGGATPNGYIAAGSGFFVRGLNASGNATFNNTMRVTGNNSQFFRTTNQTTANATNDNDNLERHRIWLNLSSPTAFSQILVGYIEGATTEIDRNFDGERFGGIGSVLYSIASNVNLGIQGRSLPFDTDDQVILGFNADVAGSFSIRIDHLDGLFDNQKIYLEDKLLNVIHNIRSAPYVFDTAIGNFNDRFVLRYNESSLGANDFNLDNSIKVIVNEKVTVHSSNQPIKNIDIFDLLGRKVDAYKNVDATQFNLNRLNKTMNVLIVKITLENGVVVTEKIIY